MCALHVTDAARARIEKFGGSIMTFEELAQLAPTGKNTLLIQGKEFIVLKVWEYGTSNWTQLEKLWTVDFLCFHYNSTRKTFLNKKMYLVFNVHFNSDLKCLWMLCQLYNLTVPSSVFDI